MSGLHAPFPSESFAALAQAEVGHWWFSARNRLLMWVFSTKIPAFQRMLEIGCGTGYVLEGIRNAFPHAELSGAEYFEEGLVFARTRVPSAAFRQLDATVMTEENCYDAIGAFDVLEHIEQDELVLHNITRALSAGGSLVVTVPQHQWLWSATDVQACHVRRYTRGELVTKIEQAGLQVTYVTSFVSLLVPLMWLSRRGGSQENCDPMAEFRIPQWMNVVLKGVMQVEFILLKCGISLPVGGSLLAVARKPNKESAR